MSYIKEIRKHIGHAPMLSSGATVAVLESRAKVMIDRLIEHNIL